MLDRVFNIKTDVGINNQQKRTDYEKFSRKKNIQELFGNDSIIFSDAAIFLSKLNWRLREIDYSNEEKIFLDFFINKFHIQTEIDFLVFYEDEYHAFNISTDWKEEDENYRFSIKLAFTKEKLIIIDNYKQVEYKGLNSLFNRLYMSEKIEKDIIIESSNLNDYTSDLDQQLLKELRYIFAAICTFVYKLGKFNIIKNHKFGGSDYVNPIKFERLLKRTL